MPGQAQRDDFAHRRLAFFFAAGASCAGLPSFALRAGFLRRPWLGAFAAEAAFVRLNSVASILLPSRS